MECEHGRIEWGGSAYTVHTGSGAAERFALEDGGQLRVNMFSELIEWIAGRPSRRCTGIQGLGQSLCVTVLHKEGVIHTVAPEFIDSVSVPEVPVIEGIEGVFRECAQAGGLPSEHGAAWSKPAVTMHVPEAMIRELDSAVAAAAVR